MKKLLLSLFACVLTLGIAVQDAEAKRLGGGKSVGSQRQFDAPTAQKQAAPQQAAPATPAAQAPAAQAPKRSWLGPLAGIAAGIGLAALLSHFGLGEGVANFLLILLAVMAVFFVIRYFMRRAQPQPAAEPLQYAGVGGPNLGPVPEADANVGTSGGAAPAPAQFNAAPIASRVPGDFDREGFLRIAKVNFIRLQAANDAGNLADIREFTTLEMFAEIKLDIDERKGTAQHTEVIGLEAELLEVVTEADKHLASVRFRGSLREEQGGAAEAFDEVWNLVKPADGSRGWALAGIQQLS